MPSLPNVSSVLDCYLQTVQYTTIDRTTVDFIDTLVPTVINIEAVVQPANPEKLNIDQIDWSLKYRLIHSKHQLQMGDYVRHNGIEYTLIIPSDWSDYGYYRSIGEEVKGDLV